MTVQELLEQFKVSSGTVVVEVNEGILPKESHPRVHLKEGDRVELVRFVGGGGEETSPPCPRSTLVPPASLCEAKRGGTPCPLGASRAARAKGFGLFS